VSKKHTPGPWYVIGEDDYRNHSIDDFMVCAQVGPDPGDGDLFITNIGPQCQLVQSEYGEINLANARLIAAAPDLLDALHAASAALDYVLRGTDDPRIARDLATVNAAISKAESQP